MARVAAIGQGTEDSGQDDGIPDAFVNRVTSSGESLRNCDDGISIHDITIREEDKVAAVDLQITQEMRGCSSFNEEKKQFPPTTTLEASDHSKIMPKDTDKTSDAEEEIVMDAIPSGEEVEADSETLDGELVRSHVMLDSSIQETAGNSKEIFTFDGDEITLEMINQYCGHAKLDDAAKKLKVSRATLKRRCRKFGIKRWPHYKRNEFHNIQSSAGLPKTNFVEVGGRVIQESEIRLCSNNDEAPAASVNHQHFPINGERVNIVPTSGNDHKGIAFEYNEIGCCASNNTKENEPAAVKGKSFNIAPGNDETDPRNNVISVLATYKDDTTLFPLCCDSGIKELCAELEDALQLEGEKYKVKYKYDDGRWIGLFRDKDLRFYIETLKASGQSTMEVSVFPDSS